MKQQHLLAAALVSALASATTTTARADDTAAASTMTPATMPADPAVVADQEPWQFAITVPLWAPQINGNATIRGHKQDLNVSFNDLKDHLDDSFALGFDMRKGKFGLYGNFGYMKFSGGFTGPDGGNTSAELKFVLANAGVSYLLVKTESEHPFMLAGTAGIRYWYTDTTLSHTGPELVWSGGKTRDVVDPVIGLRASQYLTRKLHLDVAGDFGGFNLSHHTDLTWSATAMMSYDFCRWFSLSAGYQAVALDESEGGGSSQNGVDLIFNGVAAALTFKF